MSPAAAAATAMLQHSHGNQDNVCCCMGMMLSCQFLGLDRMQPYICYVKACITRCVCVCVCVCLCVCVCVRFSADL